MLASNTAAPETVTVVSREIHNQQPLFRRFARTSNIHAFAQTARKGVGALIHQGKVWALSTDNQKYQINSMPDIICKIK